MFRGVYTSTAGMASQMAEIDQLSNNLANVDTVGYKEDFAALLQQPANPLSYGMGGLVRGTGVLSVNSTIDFSQGSLVPTGQPFDLALQGPGMFAIQSPTGISYTRNGRFHISAQNQLLSESGAVVLGANGQPLQLPDPQGNPVVIRTDGTISMNNGTVGQVGVYDAPGGWTKSGNSLFTPNGPATAITTTTIQQGMLEQSNVNLTQTMGTLMAAERSYEAALQMQQNQNQILQSAVTDIAKL